MSEKSYSHRKRIVYSALVPFFSGEKLMRAMILWDRKYSNSPSSAIQHFVYDLKNNIDQQADIRGAHMNLVKAALSPESSLLEDPSRKVDQYLEDNNLKGETEYFTPILEILEIFLKDWLELMSKIEQENVVDFVVGNISRQKINLALALQMSNWLTQQEDHIHVSQVEISDVRKVINLFYTGCCEFLGPVTADTMLRDVVGGFEHPDKEAHLVTIQQFL